MSQPATRIATGRSGSMFAADIAEARDRIRDEVEGRRVLAIGAAGSIGSSTVDVLLSFAPAVMHVVDHNENGLAELVRRLRSREQGLLETDLRTLPIDYGSAAMRYFLESEAPYDLVLNFAALKHVRTEKDPYSTLMMFDTNILKQARILTWLTRGKRAKRYFSVSTDKAANPSSLMGATKRVMEHVMFDRTLAAGVPCVTSARFANVAFSNGSLLQSFENRLARGEPIACPRDIRRYFVSLQESGEICALAATLFDDREIAIPRLNPRDHLVLLEDIARAFIEGHGFVPEIYDNEGLARRNAAKDRVAGRWPLLLTPPDTAGEKPYEEFIAEGETPKEIGLSSLQSIPYLQTEGSVAKMLEDLTAVLSDWEHDAVVLNKDRLKAIVAFLEPAFLKTHRDSTLNLDQRA